jgi:hypothetical protein
MIDGKMLLCKHSLWHFFGGIGVRKDIRSGLSVLFFGLTVLAMPMSATAQTEQSIEEFQAQVMAGANRIAQYQQTLQNPDPRVQYEAVRLLLKSKDPALVRIAKEHALFSTNPVLRNSAILAIFEAGGNLRLEVSANSENSAPVLNWVAAIGGTHDGRIGNIIFPIGSMKDDCWMHVSINACQLRVSGTTVQFKQHGNSATAAQASLTLGPDGVLRGVIFAQDGSATAAIDLKE